VGEHGHQRPSPRGVGYESQAAFSRAFKRLVGEAPGTWRARATRSSSSVR
jgi:AraC-like DNA-binding protein